MRKRGGAFYKACREQSRKTGQQYDSANAPQTFKQPARDLYMQADLAMFPDMVMVKGGKNKRFRRHGGKGQQRHKNNKADFFLRNVCHG